MGNLKMPSFTKTDLLFLLLSIFIAHFIYQIVHWRIRVAKFQRTMYVVPVLVSPWALVRRLIPEKWQTLHPDWTFRLRREYSTIFGESDIVAFVALWDLDAVFLANAEAIVEVAINPARYPKDTKLYRFQHVF